MSAATLLKHADLPQLHVTWSGATVASSDAARNRIVAAAVKPALTWKRPQSLPLPVSFAVQIVDEKSAVEAATRQDGQTLLHIFCVDSASVDAYRKGARLAAAEWFASKTAAPSVSWLLLFDSTAARTAKQRPAVLDALKKDFAKVHQSKLIEFWTTADGPAQQAFDVAIRNALLAGLQARYEQLEADLSSVRFVESDSREETVSWRGDLYVDRHWMLARLLWAAGAVEEAVRELHRSDEHVNSVSGLSGHENDLAAAPLLRTLLASRRAPAVSAVLPLRLFLLSKRLLATVALHQKRASTPSARKDHAQLAVRATHDLLKSLDEKLPAVEGSALVRRSAWRHCVAVDAWSLTTRALAEPTDGEEAALVAGHLHSIQANELLTVWHLLSDMGAKSGEDEKLALWLEAGESQRKPQQQDGVEIDAAEKLVVAIREGRQKLGQLTAERLEVAERTLRRLGWKRDAVDLAVERARILGSPGMWRTFARRAALLLLEQKDDEKQAATALLEMRENLPQELESTLAHRLVLCSYRQIPEQRRIEAAKDLLAMLDKAENEGKSAHLNAELFVKTAPDDETELYERATKAVAVGIHERDMVRVERGEKLTIHVYSRNDLSVSLKNCRITVTVKSARSATEEASVEPLTFTTVYQPVERVARVVCTNRNESEREASPQQQQQQQTKSVDDSDADKRQKQALREMTLEKIEVPPGASTVFALSTGTAGWAPGLYVVDSVELRSSALVVRGNARTERGGRSHVILIGRPAHRMEVVVPRNRNDESERDEEEQELWAGVPQRLEVRLSAGRARPTTAAVVAIQAAAAEEEYSKDSEEDRLLL